VNDIDLKTLINSAVDAELGGHRAVPPIDPAVLAERTGPTHAVRLWSAPLLAASVAVLLAVGAMLAITGNRDRNHTANPARPAPSVSTSESVSTDLALANRAYAQAVAGAREASEVPGVSVGPLSAKDAARLKGTGLITGDVSGITSPQPDKAYSFTLSYLAGPSDEPPAVLTTEVRDVASGSCAQPFVARPGHAYTIHCQAMLLAGVTGKATLTLRSPTGTSSGSMNLTDPAMYPTSPAPSASPGQAEAARAYAEALAGAPAASKVTGVSERPVTAEERQRTGETVGGLDVPVAAPKRGKSYPATLIYVPPSDAAAISVLKIRFDGVAAGRCPGPFRIRAAHAYLIRCQVTFRAGADGNAYYTLTGPHGVVTSGMNLSYR
jgi:hypothetical protein